MSKLALPLTPSNQPLLSLDNTGDLLQSIESLPHTHTPIDNNKILTVYELQKQSIAARNRSSRTLPLRRSNKRSVTSAARYKLYQQQQKVDGAYCILYETKFDQINNNSDNKLISLALNTPNRQRTATLGTSSVTKSIVTTKLTDSTTTIQSSSVCSDNDSSESESSDINSSSSDSSSDSNCESVQRNKSKSSVPPHKPELTPSQLQARHTYVMNRVGAVFGKSPGMENSTDGHLHTRRFTLNDNYISKQHFQLRFVHDRFYLWDTASSNGTYLYRQHTDNIYNNTTWKYNQQPAPNVILAHATTHTFTTQSTMTLPATSYFNADPLEQYGYLLQSHRAIRIGTIELNVTELIDDVDDCDCKCVLTYTLVQPNNNSSGSLVIPSNNSNDSGVQIKSLISPQSGKQYKILISESGITIGRHSDNSHVIEDSSIADHHLSIEFINGKFYARNHVNNKTHQQSTWLRLSPRACESLPISLYDGDKIRAGSSNFTVSLRSIPQTISPYTQPISCVDAGAAANPNFSVQKEMQDRYVCIDRYGGHDKCMYVAIFDGHQERTVADFAAAALHHNLLEQIELQMTQSQSNSAINSPKSNIDKSISNTLCVNTNNNLLQTPTSKSPTNRRTTGTMQLLAAQISPLHDQTEHCHQINDTRASIKSATRLSFRSTSLDATDQISEHSISSRNSFADTNPNIGESVAADDDTLYSGIDDTTSNDTNVNTLPLPQIDSTNVPQSLSSTPNTPPAKQGSKLPPFDMIQAIRDAYTRTAQQIRGMGDASQYGGCTASTCILWHYADTNSTVLYTANLGDSPAILLRGNGSSIRLTKSHIARDIDEQQRVRDAGGKITANNRLAGMLEVTRSFGDLGMESFGLIAEPSISSTIILSSDIYLIVSSDGIFDVISDSDVTTIVESKTLGQRSAHNIAQLLIDTALKRKTRDNMAAVIVQLQPPAAPRPMNRPNRTYTSEYGSDVLSGDDNDNTAQNESAIISPLPSTRASQHIIPATEPHINKQQSKLHLRSSGDDNNVHIQRSFTEPDSNDNDNSNMSQQSPVGESPRYLESEPDIDLRSPTNLHTHYTNQHSNPGRLPYNDEPINTIIHKSVDSFSMDDLASAKQLLSNSPITTPIPNKSANKHHALSRSQPSSPSILSDVSEFDLLQSASKDKFTLGNDGTLDIPRPRNDGTSNRSSRSLMRNNSTESTINNTAQQQLHDNQTN